MKYVILRDNAATKRTVIETIIDGSLQEAQDYVRNDAVRDIRFTSQSIEGQTHFTLEAPYSRLEIIQVNT